MTSDKLPRPPKKPCGSCPYRRDVPSGIWAMEEYVKLSRYDGEMVDQGLKGGHRLFLCHQQDGCLCGGWLAAHGPENLLALHMCAVHPTAHDYKTDVPVFSSGAEAAVHGMAEIESPSLRARQMMAAIVTKRGRRDR